jgi:hypothetical protein
MFSQKQHSNIVNAFLKYVPDNNTRSKIALLAEHLSKDEETDDQKTAVYWSTIWFCSQPNNRGEFEKMYNEVLATEGFDLPQENDISPQTTQKRKRRGNGK